MQINLLDLFGVDQKHDEKSTQALVTAINNAHLDDFDYLKFKISVKNLEEIQEDENLRFKTTFTTAQTLGVSKKYLLDTAKHYQTVLKKEKEKFSNALRKKMEDEITNKEEEGQRLDKEIKDKKRKVNELLKQIEALENRAENLDDIIESERQKIIETSDKFSAAIAHFEEVIHSDIEKINTIL